jgi:uncharacterized cupin superfamily protein
MWRSAAYEIEYSQRKYFAEGEFSMNDAPIAALAVPEQPRKTLYPPPYSARVAGRIKRRLGDHFGIKNYGINLTQLAPGAVSALLHSHTRQDEIIYVVAGHPVLVIDDAEYPLAPGDCCGFPGGTGQAHQLVNRTDTTVTYLEVGDRTPDDEVDYPNDDLMLTRGAGGSYVVSHKDGTPY